MKRNTILATVGALSMLAVPAMANDDPGYGNGKSFRDGRGRYERDVRRPAPIPEPVLLPSVRSFGPRAAKPGDTVTIRGADFVPGMKVMLGGALINPSFIGARRVVFTVPFRADDGSLSLLMPNQRRALAVGHLEVIKPARVRRGWYDTGWQRSRFSRRGNSRRAIMTRWNNHFFLDSAAARTELRIHARRLAKLNRMKRLARATGKNGLARRINRAISRENQRHDRKMAQLEGQFDVGYARRF